jgi:hypothetical protein
MRPVEGVQWWPAMVGLKVLIMSQNGEGKWRGGTDLMGGEVRSRQRFTFLTPRCAGRAIGGTEQRWRPVALLPAPVEGDGSLWSEWAGYWATFQKHLGWHNENQRKRFRTAKRGWADNRAG